MVGLPQGRFPIPARQFVHHHDIEVPDGGAEGMILTSGGRFAGYGFYLLKGKPVFLWNLIDLKRVKWEGPDALTPGKHTLEFDFKYDGLGIGTLAFNNLSGLGRSGTGTLKVDGNAVQTITMPHTLPMILQWDESFDIGSDTLTGVNDADYLPPFPLTAKLNKLTIKVDRPKLTEEDVKKLQDTEATALGQAAASYAERALVVLHSSANSKIVSIVKQLVACREGRIVPLGDCNVVAVWIGRWHDLPDAVVTKVD